jgi:hypothetical protein
VPRAGLTLGFMRILAALSVIFTLALSASPALAQRLPFETSFDAAGISTLDVSTMRGKIHIVPGDADRIVVGGAVTVRIGVKVPLNASELARKIAANPPIERAGNTVRLRPPADATERRAVTVNYEVRVPANTTVVSVSDSGETTIAGITGAVDVRTQSGAIALERVGGATTVSTGSGAVDVEGTRGPLKVATSSSAFTARGLGGNLHARTMSGAVNASFDGGGDVDIATGSSAIRLSGVQGAVTAVSQSGRIALEGKPARAWATTTGSGSIEVAVASPPLSIDATSGSGSVEVIGARVDGAVSKRAINGAIGNGGPMVRLSSRSGSIRINVGR